MANLSAIGHNDETLHGDHRSQQTVKVKLELQRTFARGPPNFSVGSNKRPIEPTKEPVSSATKRTAGEKKEHFGEFQYEAEEHKYTRVPAGAR